MGIGEEEAEHESTGTMHVPSEKQQVSALLSSNYTRVPSQSVEKPAESEIEQNSTCVENEERDCEPSLAECRKVLRFLSSRDVPVASYMLRTYNGFESDKDLSNLLDSVSQCPSDAINHFDADEGK